MATERSKGISRRFRHWALPPILIAIGIGVAVVSSVILWQQDPNASARTIVSRLVDRIYIPGASVGLTALGIVMMFFFSSKEMQKKSVNAGLMVLAAFLVFGGPTYLLYVLQGVAVPYPFVAFFGLACFVVGLLLFMRLLKGKE